MSSSESAHQSLEPVALTRWQPRSDPQPLDLPPASDVALDPKRPLWLEYCAPRPEGPPKNAGDYKASYDHTDLIRTLDCLDILATLESEDRARCQLRLAALKDETLWLNPDGLWMPGVHFRHGVVTASAVAPAKQKVLDIVQARSGVLLGSMSFVVFPGCVVSIAWRPRTPLDRAPTPEQHTELGRELDTMELVYFKTYERFRARVTEAWMECEDGGQAGDLAVVAIGCLLDSTAPTISALRKSFDMFEYASLAATPSAAEPTKPGEPDDSAGFRDFHRSVGALREDVAAVVKYRSARMHFVGDKHGVQQLIARYESTADELRELKGDLRAALDAISSATVARLLGVAREQEELARVAADARGKIDLLAGFLAPAVFWAAVYSAAVALPGKDRLSGTIILIVLMILSILGTVTWLRPARAKPGTSTEPVGTHGP